jgi:transcription elongation factor GreA
LVAQDYLSLVRSQDLDALETAWVQALTEPGEVDRYCQTVRELGARGEIGTAIELGSRMVEALDERGRTADAVRLGTAMVTANACNESLTRKLYGLAEKAFAAEPWFDLAREVSGLRAENLSPAAFAAFDMARHLTPGHVVYHRAGWDEGVVEELDVDARQVRIRFKNGMRKDLPVQSAIESLKLLDEDDLRAMRMVRADELKRLAEERPAEVIRMAAKAYRGRISSTQLKTELTGSVIPSSKWNSWWKGAKTAAANDPWLLIEGSAARPVFELRKVPISLGDEAARAMRHALDLPGVIEVCRDYLGRGLDEAAQTTVLDLAQARVEQELGKHRETPASLLDGILFLEEHGRSTSVPAAQELREMLTGAEGFEPEAIDNLQTQKSREHAVRLLPEAFGETWADECVKTITRFPKSVAEQVIDLLHEKEVADHLCAAWGDVAPYPRKHPILTFRLGKLFADGAFDQREDKPDLLSVNRVLLHLCRVIAKEPKSNTALQRIKMRVASLLVGRRGILHACLEEVGRDDLASMLGIAERGGPDFPQEVTDAILKVVARRHPDITSKPERPFWDRDEFIFVTAEGLKRKREEHRVLVDEKIPLNAESIGNAAALGDLSENSEWEAAMEEQRNLTGRAEEMSREIRSARLIENQDLPDGVVTPGSQVTFTFLDDNKRQRYRILGPWDAVEDDILNYRAPLAQALLGKKVGEEAELDGPTGVRRVRVDQITKLL